MVVEVVDTDDVMMEVVVGNVGMVDTSVGMKGIANGLRFVEVG